MSIINDNNNIKTTTKNAEQNANIFSKFTLLWIGSLIKKGFKKHLDIDDIWDIHPIDDPKLNYDKFNNNINEQLKLFDDNNNNKKKSTFKAIWPLFSYDVKIMSIFYLLYESSRFAGPVLIGLLISWVTYVQENGINSENNNNDDILINYSSPTTGYLLAAALALAQLCTTLFFINSEFRGVRTALKIRNTLTSAVFHHAITLDESSVSKGQVINLVSADAQIALELMRFFNRIW